LQTGRDRDKPGPILADHPFGKRTAQPTVW
jgi:hypothetical protein